MAEELRLLVVSNFGKRQTRKEGWGTPRNALEIVVGHLKEILALTTTKATDYTDKTQLKSYRILREVYSTAFRGSPVDWIRSKLERSRSTVAWENHHSGRCVVIKDSVTGGTCKVDQEFFDSLGRAIIVYPDWNLFLKLSYIEWDIASPGLVISRRNSSSIHCLIPDIDDIRAVASTLDGQISVLSLFYLDKRWLRKIHWIVVFGDN